MISREELDQYRAGKKRMTLKEAKDSYLFWYDRWMNGFSDDREIAKGMLPWLEKTIAELEKEQNETKH